MKKSLLALAVLGAFSGVASAQSSVVIYGVVDSAVRLTTSEGPKGDDTITRLIPGGMAGSRLGFNVTEDLGGGLWAIANMEHRFNSDTGASTSATDFWRQSWVGLKSSSFGTVTLGRQYNVLFDAYTFTYSSFKYSPYIEAFKPELSMALGARQDNMVKYNLSVGGFTGELQVSAGEGAGAPAGVGKTMGGLLKYAFGPFAAAGAYLKLDDHTGQSVEGLTVGGAYTSGPLYVNLSYARTEYEQNFNPLLDGAYLANAGAGFGASGSIVSSTGGAALAKTREMITTGVTYQVTPALNLGGQYWHMDQDGRTSGAQDGSADAFAFVASYFLSKRTSTYFEVDHSTFDKIKLANGKDDRTGVMLGLRHNF